jgi:hypothetical protein
MFGWRPTPEALLKERCRDASRELRRNAREQQDTEAAISKLTQAIRAEKDPNKRKALCSVLIQKQMDQKHLIDSAQRTQRTMRTMERSKDTARRLKDTKALAASMSSMARQARPESVAKTHEMIMTAQASIEMTEDILDDLDRPDHETQQDMEDQVALMLEQIDSENALKVTIDMPSPASFPAIPAVAASSSSSVDVDEIQQRLDRLMNL